MRTELDLDVALGCELADEFRVARYVDAALSDVPIRAGACDRREDSYCHYVATGQLPQLVADASRRRDVGRNPVGCA